MPSPPPPYSPPPPPPVPYPDCPTTKSEYAAILVAQRAKWDTLRTRYLNYYGDKLEPIYAEYVTNAPADESTECGRLAAYYTQTGEAWLSSWDQTFLGVPNSPDLGLFNNASLLIDAINCSASPTEIANALQQARYMLDGVWAKLREAEDRLNQWIQTVYMLSQQCPVPRPE